MLKLCLFFAAVFSASIFAKSPPIGTAYTISYTGAGGAVGHLVYEEDATCLNQIANFGNVLHLKAAVPVYPAQRAGLTRVFALGKTMQSHSELWLVDPSPTRSQKFAYSDVVSISPYSNQDVLVAQKNGEIFIVDGDGLEIHKFSLTDHFPKGFTHIGDLVNAWRSGTESISVLTQNFFLHIRPGHSVIIQMNSTTPTAPNTHIPSFDLGAVFTGIGDDNYVCIVHDWTNPSPTPSFSIFKIPTGKFIQRHVAPGPIRGFGPVTPVYFESATQTAYFGMNDNFIGINAFSVTYEQPAGQLSANGLGRTPPGAALSVVLAPPVQGTPWGTRSPSWMTPKWSSRGTGATGTLINSPPNFSPGVLATTVTPPHPSAGPTANTTTQTALDPNEKKIVFGVERTRADFTMYVEQELGNALDTGKQVSSAKLVQQFGSIDRALRMELNGLSDTFLKSHGVEYSSNGLQMHGPNQLTPSSEWVEELWKGFKLPGQ